MERQGSRGALGRKHESQKPSWALRLVQLGDNHLNALAQENLRGTHSREPGWYVMQQEMARTDAVCYFYHHLSFFLHTGPLLLDIEDTT